MSVGGLSRGAAAGTRAGRPPRGTAAAAAAAAALLWAACEQRPESRVGTPDVPARILLFPADDPATVAPAARAIEAALAASGVAARVDVPASHLRAVEDLGARRADAAFLADFAWLLAHDAFGARAALRVVRDGRSTHGGALFVRAGGDIATIADLGGRAVAFTDPYSTTGFLLAARRLRGVTVGRTWFAGSHERALRAVIDGKAGAAAGFYNAARDREVLDARRTLGDPATASGIRVLALTGEVSNEPVAFRAGVRPDLRRRIEDALLALDDTAEGRSALARVADVTGIERVQGDPWLPLRRMVREAGRDIEEMVPGGWKLRLREMLPMQQF